MSRVVVVGLSVLLGALSSGCAVGRLLLPAPAVLPEPRVGEGLANRIDADGEVPNGRVDHFAVLIGANTELRHRGNLAMAYQVLVEQGYRREDVYILDSDGESDFFPVTDVTSRAAVRRLFEHLKKIVEPHDTLLVYVTGHGHRIEAEKDQNGARSKVGVSTIRLNAKEDLTEWELASYLDGLAPDVALAFFDQCYGAIFSTIAKSCRWVFITAAAEDETSWGVSFPRAFWGAFRARSTPAAPLGVREAYELARSADKATKLGYNRPHLTEGCVDVGGLTLLGELRAAPTVLSSNAAAAPPR